MKPAFTIHAGFIAITDFSDYRNWALNLDKKQTKFNMTVFQVLTD